MKNKVINCILIILFLLIILIFREDVLNIINSIYNSFYRTVIEEDRYILFLKGLGATIVISFFSIIIGTVLGFVLFFLQRIKVKIFDIFSYVIVRFLQGVPITVLLLVFYFGIFSSVNIGPLVVAIIAFSIYFSAYVAEIFKGAYASINKMQIEAAYSMGFTKIQTLKYIIIPQVLSYIIPVYKNESVSLIKLTSIAGFISVMELTKVSDIIRNRTYEAFFPLIFTAILYFIICYLFSKLLDYINKKVNPRMVKKA